MCLEQLMGHQVQQTTSSTTKRLTQITKAALEDPQGSLYCPHAACRLEAFGHVLTVWLEDAATGRQLHNRMVRVKQSELILRWRLPQWRLQAAGLLLPQWQQPEAALHAAKPEQLLTLVTARQQDSISLDGRLRSCVKLPGITADKCAVHPCCLHHT